jgi:hypothetical protein
MILTAGILRTGYRIGLCEILRVTWHALGLRWLSGQAGGRGRAPGVRGS